MGLKWALIKRDPNGNWRSEIKWKNFPNAKRAINLYGNLFVQKCQHKNQYFNWKNGKRIFHVKML